MNVCGDFPSLVGSCPFYPSLDSLLIIRKSVEPKYTLGNMMYIDEYL